MSCPQLFRLSQTKIVIYRSVFILSVGPVNGFKFTYDCPVPNGIPHGTEQVVQRSVNKEKDRGYILTRQHVQGLITGKEVLHKYTQLTSTHRATDSNKWPAENKILMFEYEWKHSHPPTWEEDKKFDRLKLLGKDPKWDDFDRYAVKCLYEWLHARFTNKPY